ncbi:uncharacterized protein MELLADRAFT_61913 [Melampsora larici-populina 98AG31]|uniref:Uncharacterized protein n=1 Tax=Melampsora larici-populina (strain 98AG31 / pathotype 3-4-7) TaxID=747676 RepID=F4RGX9_MELLP|nr:uncharacterized protein MELLADRAFT_61913 [Melampsora larici-populina 98AG31]EGG08408.1 hypothetical protein MELLADRAFT_61913 [Melampsora larici-populina 98AG31]
MKEEIPPVITTNQQSKISSQRSIDKAVEEILANEIEKEVHSNTSEDIQIIPECQPNETISHPDQELRNIGQTEIVENPGDDKERSVEKGKLSDLQQESSPKETHVGENIQQNALDANENTDLDLEESNLVAEDESKKVSNDRPDLNNDEIATIPILHTKPLVTRTRKPRKKSSRKLFEDLHSQTLPSEPTTSSSLNLPQNELITKAEMIEDVVQAHDTEEVADILSKSVENSKDEETKRLEGSTSDDQKRVYLTPSHNTRRKTQKSNKSKSSSKKLKNPRKKAASESMMKASEPDTSESTSLALHSQSPTDMMSQSQFGEILEQILKIPGHIFMRHALKFDDKRQNIQIDVTNLQFAYVLRTNLLSDKEQWFSTCDGFQYTFGDIKEAYRRIISFSAQCNELIFVYNFENKKESIPQASIEFGKLFKFDQFFPHFLDYKIGKWKQVNVITKNLSKTDFEKLYKNSASEVEKRKASMFMMTFDDTYRNSKFLKYALSSGFLCQGAILSLMGTISHVLDLSSEKVNWKTLTKAEIINRVNQLIKAMHGRVTLQIDLMFAVFEHPWVEEYTRSIFVNEEGISHLFQERLKNLAILADGMGIKPSDLGLKADGLQKLTAGEFLIANHVGLEAEELIEFKVWLKSDLNQGRKSSRVLGNWDLSVPQKCWNKGHAFIEYFHYRKEKISGLENWKLSHPYNPILMAERENETHKLNPDNLDESIKSCLKYLDF